MGDGDVFAVTVENIGNRPTGAITVSPVAGNGGFSLDSYALSGGLDVGGSAQFTIVPIDGLSAGTYNVTIAIGPTSSDSDLNTVMFTATFNVASSDPHYVITATSDAGSVISPPGQTEVAQGDDAAFTFQAIDGYRVSSVHVDGIPISSGELESGTYTFRDVSDDHTIDVTSEYAASPSDPHYVITATSDAGSVISPSGQTVVAQGGDATFTFRAADGYHVSSVYVDGKPLSSEELSSGTYTFRNVLSNHSIEVVSAPGQILPDMVLEITVASGHGYAEYSINGSPFERYVSAVALTDGDDVTVAAYADEGYEFKEWSREGILYPDAGTMFENVDSSLYLEIHFVTVAYGTEPDDGVPWWVVGIIVLLIAGGFFFWLLIFWRRYYEVIPPEGMEEVEGYKRAHRKSEYRYLMPDGYSGPMVYHIGEEEEDNEWKPVLM
jgi:hypothetical protein